MYLVKVLCPSALTDSVIDVCRDVPGVGTIGVRQAAGSGDPSAVVEAEIPDQSVASALEALSADAAADLTVTVVAMEDAQRFSVKDGQVALVEDASIEGLGLLGSSSALRRLVRVDYQYILLMMAAAVIATVGLVSGLPIAIVGAMAFSPDLGRLNAIAFSLLTRESRLLISGVVSLSVGMVVVVLTSAVWSSLAAFAGVSDALAAVPDSLTTFVTVIDVVTITVALAAGVAAMVVFISDRARAAVGVGVSITTLPAASYTGIAIAEGAWSAAGDALVVLLVNVACVTVAGVLTGLVLRRHLRHRAAMLGRH